MATQRVRCRKCRKQFSKVLGSRRLDCETCSPPRVESEPSVEVPGEQLGLMETQVLADLEAAARVETTAGALALHLARQLDAGGHSGSQTAALAARLLDAQEKATAGSRPDMDELDELQSRRLRRASGA